MAKMKIKWSKAIGLCDTITIQSYATTQNTSISTPYIGQRATDDLAVWAF